MIKKNPADPPGATHPGYLPADALHHYPRSAQGKVSREAVELQAERRKRKITRARWRELTTAGIQGELACVVPAADECLHVPLTKAPHGIQGGLLLGRSPYDQPNLRPIPPERIRTVANQDPTAQFLETCWSAQYSLVGQWIVSSDPTPDTLQVEVPLFFAKGMVVVIDDTQEGLWPEAFKDRDMVISAMDPKTKSDWVNQKERVTQNTYLSAPAILTFIRLLKPGSLIAVPIVEQEKLGGDFDGDEDLMITGYQALYQHVAAYDISHSQQKHTSLVKKLKTHTSAYSLSKESYLMGRSQQIIAALSHVLQDFVGLQRTFLQQPLEMRERLARAICFEVFEGLPADYSQILTHLLTSRSPSLNAIEKLKKHLHAFLEEKRPEFQDNTGYLVMQALLRDVMADLELWEQDPTGKSGTRAIVSSNNLKLTSEAEETKEVQTALAELRPKWRQQRAQWARDLRGRLEVAVHEIPTCLLKKEFIYAKEAANAVIALLSDGIVVGTDAYKSESGNNAVSTSRKKSVSSDAKKRHSAGSVV